MGGQIKSIVWSAHRDVSINDNDVEIRKSKLNILFIVHSEIYI